MFAHIFSSRRGRYLSGDGFFRRERRRSTGSSLLRDLVAHWKLEEGSGVRYDSVASQHLFAHGNVGQAEGIVGSYAAQFTPATEDYLSCAGTPGLRMAGTDFTIAGWVLLNSLEEACVVGKWGDGSMEYFVATDGMHLYFGVSGSGVSTTFVTSTEELETGLWFHFAAWYDTAQGTLNISVNNESPCMESYSNGVFAGGGDLNLGRSAETGVFLAGRLDSVSIWKRCLSTEERGRLYNGGAGVEWPF